MAGKDTRERWFNVVVSAFSDRGTVRTKENA